MTLDRVPSSIEQRKNRHTGKVVFRQFHLAIENRDQVFARKLRLFRVRTVTFQAQSVGRAGTQQMLVITAVRLVTGIAALDKYGLVMNFLLRQIGDVGVAAEADVYRIRFWQSRIGARVRIVTVGTVPGRSRMLHFRLLDLLDLVRVARDAQIFHVRLCQDNLSGFRRGVTGLAPALFGKWRMEELGHELWLRRLVRVVALQAVRCRKRLVLVRLLQGCICRIVAIQAQGGGSLRQVKAVFSRRFCACLVDDMAGVAAHVEGRVSTPFLRNIRALRVTSETEIVFLFARGGLQQLVLIFCRMRIVAFQAIAYRRWMDLAFDLGGIFVGVAGQAQTIRGRSDELYAGGVLVDPDLMAAQTAHRDGRVHGLAFGLILVTLQTRLGVCLWVERYRMHRAESTRYAKHRQRESEKELLQKVPPVQDSGGVSICQLITNAE